MRIPDHQLDIDIAALQATNTDPERLDILLELRERRRWWISRVCEAAGSRVEGPSVAGWCLIIAAVMFVLGAVAVVAMPTRTTSAILGGVSMLFLALGMLLRPRDFGHDTESRSADDVATG